MIECNKESCKQRHICETEVDLKTWISQHQGSINTKKLDPPTRKQFNQPGHSKHNLKATVLEKIKINDLQYRKARKNSKILQRT